MSGDRPWLACGRWYLHRRLLPGQGLLAAALDHRLQHRPVTAMARTRFGAVLGVTSTDLIQRFVYLFGVWEPHLTHWLTRRIRPGDTVIDVGANIGYFTLLAAHLTGPAGHVVAIEPAPAFCQALADTIRAGGTTNVRIVNAAVAAAPARVAFYQPDPGNLGSTSMLAPRDPSARPVFEVDARPLPGLLAPGELAAARVIKIDAEGAEADVVTGLAPRLGDLRPDAELVIEVAPRLLRRAGRCLQQVTGPLIEAGFHPYLLANDYRARTYPRAIARPQPPVRLHPPLTGLRDPSDLVFSRVDADHLP